MTLTSPRFLENSPNFGVAYIRPPCAYPRFDISLSWKLDGTLVHEVPNDWLNHSIANWLLQWLSRLDFSSFTNLTWPLAHWISNAINFLTIQGRGYTKIGYDMKWTSLRIFISCLTLPHHPNPTTSPTPCVGSIMPWGIWEIWHLGIDPLILLIIFYAMHASFYPMLTLFCYMETYLTYWPSLAKL